MKLTRLVQKASILAGMTFTSLSIYSNPAQASTPQICIFASNGKTVCGTLRAVERACVTTNGSDTICGKFKSAIEGQDQSQQTSRPSQATIARKEVDNFVVTLKGCRKSESTVKCELLITNKGAERDFLINSSYSNILDSSGKSYKGTMADIGGESGSFINRKITPGIDYTASVTFENIPEQLVRAEILELDSRKGAIQFRKVPLSN